MNRNAFKLIPVAIVAAAVLLSACHHHDSSSGMPPPDNNPPGGGTPPPPQPTNFTSFVHGLFADSTTETALPTEVDQTEFTFPDDDNSTAYDDLIAPAP